MATRMAPRRPFRNDACPHRSQPNVIGREMQRSAPRLEGLPGGAAYAVHWRKKIRRPPEGGRVVVELDRGRGRLEAKPMGPGLDVVNECGRDRRAPCLLGVGGLAAIRKYVPARPATYLFWIGRFPSTSPAAPSMHRPCISGRTLALLPTITQNVPCRYMLTYGGATARDHARSRPPHPTAAVGTRAPTSPPILSTPQLPTALSTAATGTTGAASYGSPVLGGVCLFWPNLSRRLPLLASAKRACPVPCLLPHTYPFTSRLPQDRPTYVPPNVLGDLPTPNLLIWTRPWPRVTTTTTTTTMMSAAGGANSNSSSAAAAAAAAIGGPNYRNPSPYQQQQQQQSADFFTAEMRDRQARGKDPYRDSDSDSDDRTSVDYAVRSRATR